MLHRQLPKSRCKICTAGVELWHHPAQPDTHPEGSGSIENYMDVSNGLSGSHGWEFYRALVSVRSYPSDWHKALAQGVQHLLAWQDEPATY